MGIRFSDGNADRITANNFLSRLWNLVDYRSRLKWQIGPCRQQSNVEVRGVKFGFGVFIYALAQCGGHRFLMTW